MSEAVARRGPRVLPPVGGGWFWGERAAVSSFVLTGTNPRLSLQGGPCGVLAAVQGCVLQKLLFEGDSRAVGPR